MLVVNEPRAAHCLLHLRRIEEVGRDATFSDVQTTGFGLCLPYDFGKGTIDHLGELVVKRNYTLVYRAVEREFGHEGPHVAGKPNHARKTLNSSQTEMDRYAFAIMSVSQDAAMVTKIIVGLIQSRRLFSYTFVKRVGWFLGPLSSFRRGFMLLL